MAHNRLAVAMGYGNPAQKKAVQAERDGGGCHSSWPLGAREDGDMPLCLSGWLYVRIYATRRRPS